MGSGEELQTLKRGLQALAFLNTEGPANVACVARRLDVPRANAHRIVHTLTTEGYCRKIPNSHLYISNLQSKDIAINPSAAGVITSVSIDIVEELSRVLVWPLALSTPQGSTMVTRLATHLASPLALTKIVPGHVCSMLDASTGFIYLALCGEQRRDAALAEAEAGPHAEDLRTWRSMLPALLESIRQDGYFILQRPGPEASIGVPILLDGQPVAGISMRYIKSATTRSHVINAYLPRLLSAAKDISDQLAALRDHRSSPEVERSQAAEPALPWNPTPAMHHAI